MPKRVGDLELDQGLVFQRREWAFERAGWVGMACLILLGAVGLFGEGPLSETSVVTSGGEIEADYERFARRGGETDISISIDPEVITQEELVVALPSDYAESFRIEAVTPQPDSVEIEEGDYVYSFLVVPGSQAAVVSFDLRVEAMGPHSGTIEANGSELTLNHFFYP